MGARPAVQIGPPRISLVWKLALAYLALALIAAVAVRVLSLSIELHALDRDLGRGLLQRATAEAANQVAAELPRAGRPGPAVVRRSLTTGLRSIEEALSESGHKGVLAELGNPIGVALQGADGRILGHLGGRTPGPRAGDPHSWRYRATLDGGGALIVELNRRPPGIRALMGDGFEWPALLVYAAVFCLGSALVLQLSVTRRLGAIARTADAWSAGDFSHAVSDASADEIGQLSRRLDRMARELEALVAVQAEYAGLSERQRLARELHDTVKQKAFALQLQLAAAGRAAGLDPQVARTLEDARNITREIQEELAQLIGDRPALSDQPFEQLLAERIEAWGRRGRFTARAELAAAHDVPLAHRPIVVRVLDEALANVMRHAEAAEAVVRLSAPDGRFELTVEDDGRGLRRVAEGMGLRNMRQRAAELPEGSLTLDAGERGGVRLIMNWRRAMTGAE